MQRKCANLCHCFFQFDISRNYDLILNYWNFRTLNSRRHHLDALFLINDLMGKINCHSTVDTVCIHVPTRHKEFSALSVSSALQHSSSARCAIAANDICRVLNSLIKTLSLLRTLPLHRKVSKLIISFSLILF
jgi:hypothetical protein